MCWHMPQNHRRTAAKTIWISQVDEALRDGVSEYQSISEARSELLRLQEEIEVAHKRLHVTQARVEQNVQKMSELKAEAAEFERLKGLTISSAQLASTHPEAAEHIAPVGLSASSAAPQTRRIAPRQRDGAYPQAAAPVRAQSKKARGLQSSLNLEPGLRNFWCVPLTSCPTTNLRVPER
jgi:chlorophyllide a oxygenase